MERLSLDEKFGEMFRQNISGSPGNASDVGSTIDAIDAIRAGLMSIGKEFAVKSLLDAPCGDYG